MGNSVGFRNKAVNAVARDGGADWFSLHYGDPGTSGANEIGGGTYGRVQVPYPAAINGSSTNLGATHNVPANTDLTHFGRWDAQTGGNFFSGGPLPNGGDHYGSPGTYTNINTVTQP